MKPVIFCDVDGVVNQFPYRYERETDGSHDVAVEYGGMMNYGFRRAWFDESVHFRDTDFVMVDTVKGLFPIVYSSEMVERLRLLIFSDAVEFVWLSTWREEAVRLLNPLFGFPSSVGFLPWLDRRGDSSQNGKLNAVVDFFVQRPEFVDRKMVWLDDVATKGFETWVSGVGFVTPKVDLSDYGVNVDGLIVKTDEFFGLSREELTAVEGFVR